MQSGSINQREENGRQYMKLHLNHISQENEQQIEEFLQ